MWITITLAILALLAAGFLVWISRQHRIELSGIEDLAANTRPVDIEAFRNLVDVDETEFLRRRLPPSDFRKVQRERTLAATEYVRNISHNAKVLIKLGQSARDAQDAELRRVAAEMVQSALSVRMLAMRVLVLLYIDSVFPAFRTSQLEILQDYRELTSRATLFTRLQRPAFAGRVSAML